MFDIDVAGLAELEGGKRPEQLAMEPIANVFDEVRGYGSDRRKPTYCRVTLEHSTSPRGVWLTVVDDGPGFGKAEDIWTLFGTTAKRSEAGVSGRFNMGDKQLLAVARGATVSTVVDGKTVAVNFANGEKTVTRHRSKLHEGTTVKALMPWTIDEMHQVRLALLDLNPPAIMDYFVNDQQVGHRPSKCGVGVTLPTVLLEGGVMRPTTRKTVVLVVPSESPMLYELGVPICDLKDLEFPWSLDVQQKVPVPPSRDTVSPAYLFRLIGSVLEQAAMDGHKLLTEEQQGASFIKHALDWVREPGALKLVTDGLYGENAVRRSTNVTSNAQAELAGSPIIDGRCFTGDTRKRMSDAGVLPTSHEKYRPLEPESTDEEGVVRCPTCKGSGQIPSY